MRAKLILVSLLTGWSFQSFAQTPPQNVQEAPAQPAAEQTQTPRTNSPDALERLEASLMCAAAIQVTALAAPNWAQEPGVSQSSNLWLAEAYAASEAYGVASEKVPQLIQGEMERQLHEAVETPQALSRRAFDCVASPPQSMR